MLTLYGKTYARSDREAVASLFNAGGTVNGFAKVTRAGIILSDLRGEERVFIRKDGLGPVTTFRHEGRRRYMFATTSKDDLWLHVPDSFIARNEGAAALARAAFPS